jgi:phage baseplate assembly protein gpV
METAWVLRYDLPDIFEQVVISLRDRMSQRIEELEEPVISNSKPAASASADEEESAL